MHAGAICVARSRLREVECSPEMGPEAPQISQTASFDAIRLHRDLGLSAHSTLLAAPRAILVQTEGLRNTCTRAHWTEYLSLGLDFLAASK